MLSHLDCELRVEWSVYEQTRRAGCGNLLGFLRARANNDVVGEWWSVRGIHDTVEWKHGNPRAFAMCDKVCDYDGESSDGTCYCGAVGRLLMRAEMDVECSVWRWRKKRGVDARFYLFRQVNRQTLRLRLYSLSLLQASDKTH